MYPFAKLASRRDIRGRAGGETYDGVRRRKQRFQSKWIDVGYILPFPVFEIKTIRLGRLAINQPGSYDEWNSGCRAVGAAR